MKSQDFPRSFAPSNLVVREVLAEDAVEALRQSLCFYLRLTNISFLDALILKLSKMMKWKTNKQTTGTLAGSQSNKRTVWSRIRLTYDQKNTDCYKYKWIEMIFLLFLLSCFLYMFFVLIVWPRSKCTGFYFNVCRSFQPILLSDHIFFLVLKCLLNPIDHPQLFQ